MRMTLATKRTVKMSKKTRIKEQRFVARMLKKVGQKMFPKMRPMPNLVTHKQRKIAKLIKRGIMEPLPEEK